MDTLIESKRCSRCREVKPFDEFPRMRSAATGRRPDCKPCHAGAVKTNRAKLFAADPERYRRQKTAVVRKWRYGITSEEYDALLGSQDGGCAICGAPDSRRKVRSGDANRQLCVDHDHKTGEIRGLLCDPCNNGIARFDDDVAMLEAAIAYLGGQ